MRVTMGETSLTQSIVVVNWNARDPLLRPGYIGELARRPRQTPQLT